MHLRLLSTSVVAALVFAALSVPPAQADPSPVGPAPAAAPASCQGLRATIVATSPGPVTGTSGDDVIVGTVGADVIDAGAGNDTICPGEGDDTVQGGPGLDTVVFDGATGVTADLTTGVASGQGHDTLTGVENLTGGPGEDALVGDSGVNVLRGARGNDSCDGRAGNDTAVDCDRGTVRINPPGSVDTYLYTVPAAGRALFVDSLSAAPVGGALRWTLTDGNGPLFTNADAARDAVVDSRLAGAHQLTVSGSTATTTGTLQFRVVLPADVRETVVPGTTLADAPVISVSLRVPGQDARYEVRITDADIAAQKVLTAAVSNGTWGSLGCCSAFRIIDPNGNNVAYASQNNTVTVTTDPLTLAGTYVVLLDLQGLSTGTGTLRVVKPLDVRATVVPGTTLADAEPIAVSLPTPGQNARYSVRITDADIAAQKVLTFAVSNGTWGSLGCCSAFRILDPNGNNVAYASQNNTVTVTTDPLTLAGTYVVLLDLVGISTGRGQLQIIKPVDVRATVVPGTTLADAEPIAVSLPTPGQNARYSVRITDADIAAQKVLTFAVSNGTWGSLGCCSAFRILDPNGNNVAYASQNNTVTVTTDPLTLAGTYVVLLDLVGISTGRGQLQIIKPVDVRATVVPGTTLADAEPIAVSLPTPGQNARYSVRITDADIAAQKVLTFAVSNGTWGSLGCCSAFRILDPNGNNVAYASQNNTVTVTTDPLTLAGTYTVLLDLVGTTTGTGTIRIAKPAI